MVLGSIMIMLTTNVIDIIMVLMAMMMLLLLTMLLMTIVNMTTMLITGTIFGIATVLPNTQARYNSS